MWEHGICTLCMWDCVSEWGRGERWRGTDRAKERKEGKEREGKEEELCIGTSNPSFVQLHPASPRQPPHPFIPSLVLPLHWTVSGLVHQTRFNHGTWTAPSCLLHWTFVFRHGPMVPSPSPIRQKVTLAPTCAMSAPHFSLWRHKCWSLSEVTCLSTSYLVGEWVNELDSW